MFQPPDTAPGRLTGRNRIGQIGKRRWLLRKEGFFGACTVLGLILSPTPLRSQQALRESLAGDAAIAARRAEGENQPYTFKSGDFRLLASPSLGLAYNDNITVTDHHQLDDFILQPFLGLRATYPITRANLLRLNLGIG